MQPLDKIRAIIWAHRAIGTSAGAIAKRAGIAQSVLSKVLYRDVPDDYWALKRLEKVLAVDRAKKEDSK